RQVIATNQVFEEIDLVPRQNGEIDQFLVYKFPISDLVSQTLVGGVAIDITEQERAKEQLRLLNDRLQYLLINAPVAIFSCQANGDYGATSMSENIRTILGYESREFLEDSNFWANHIHPEDRDRVIAEAPQIFVTGHHAHEYRFLHANGTYRWVFNQLQLMRDAAGTPTEIIGYLVDISDRKQAEQALQEREAFLRAIGDNLPNGYLYQLMRELDGRYRYTYISAGIERVSGLNPDAVLADSSLMFNLLLEDDLPYVLQKGEESAKNLSVFDIQVRERLSNGESRWLQLCSTPRRLEDGRVIWDGIRLDINGLKQTEESLRQSEAKNRAMLAAIPDLLLRVKRDGSCLDFIPATDPQSGAFLPIDTHLSEVLPPDLLQYELQRMEQALATGELQIWEHQFMKGNKLCDEEVRLIPCGDEEVLMIVRDISDRKQAEEALRRYERIVSASTDAILLIDRNYVYQVVNQAYLNWYNKRQDEIIGHSICKVMPQALFEHTIKPRLDQCLNGQVVQYEMWVEYPALGRQFLSITYNPYFDTNQTISGVVVSLRNITRLKQAEIELELQGVIVRNMAEGACMVRIEDEMIVYANPKFEQIFGYELGELKNQPVSILNYEDEQVSAEEVHHAIKQEVTQHGEATYEVQNVKKDGTAFWCRATTSIFQHPEHGTVLLAVQQDITEQKQAAEQIRVSLREKEVLLKEIHHRVKNNLGIVDGLLKMQSRRATDPQVIATLKESQNRIASIALVHEKLYRSEDLANIDFVQYIADLTAHLFDSYNTHSNQIHLKTNIANIPLDIDTAIPCGLIINELVSNALKYAFPHLQPGEIQVTFQQNQDQSLTLIVRDNGIGLSQDFSLKQTKTLGITLVKGLVKQLKGTLEVSAQPGSTFIISLNKP
ncbi:MAG TPA: PAS domain S-box protein, partial [Coleofasciculaceae cyanobacterium]